MNRIASIVFSWITAVCLTLYGPLGMAAASESGASFAMEICSDGSSETIFVTLDGTPVEPSHDCQDCLVCSHAMAGALQFGCAVNAAHSPMVLVLDLTSFDLLCTPTPNKRPMPRGPPLGRIAIKTDRAADGHNTQGDGRPLLKDASA